VSRLETTTTTTPPNGIAVAEPSMPRTVFDEIGSQMQTRKSFIAEALDRSLNLDVFMGRVLNEVRKNPQLAECSFASLMGGIVTAAQLGLEPGPLGHFYFTPRRNSVKRGDQWVKVWEVVPVIGYKGYIALGRRAGGMSIDADNRCENDRWIYRRGTDPYLETAPPDRGERGELFGYWAAAKFDGGSAAHYMPLVDLEAHAKKYASNYKGEIQGFAKANWEGWCKKTVVRQMAWKLPQSTQMAQALERDENPNYWRDDTSDVQVSVQAAEGDDFDVPADQDPTVNGEMGGV
jgi:recombination protein RecT